MARGATLTTHPLAGDDVVVSRTNGPLLALQRLLRARGVPCDYNGREVRHCREGGEAAESDGYAPVWTQTLEPNPIFVAVSTVKPYLHLSAYACTRALKERHGKAPGQGTRVDRGTAVVGGGKPLYFSARGGR